MLTKLSQWVPIQFCPLLHRFLSESCDIKCYVKPRRSSLFDVSFRILDYVIISHQALLSKTTKHWDGFVSHCNLVYSPALASALWFALRLAKEQKVNLKTENGINTIFIIVSSNIRPAYVKLGLAHNMVCSPALVLAPRMAIRLAEQ